MNSQLYPLQFAPIYKEKIWGGSKLRSILGKDIPSDKTGESKYAILQRLRSETVKNLVGFECEHVGIYLK